MSDKPVVWSYSSLSLFQLCPKKYYHLRVAKDHKEPQSEHMRYGLDLHKAAEEYIRDGKPLDPGFAFLQGVLDKLKAYPGEKLCEMKLGLTRDLEPCGFFDKNVWWRGIADLLIINGNEARVVDYKSGRDKYADMKQLEILSLAVFKHYPQVKVVKAGLLFVIHTNFIKEQYTKEQEPVMWTKWLPETHRLEQAVKTNVWNAKPNFTCSRWCVVFSCNHNGRNR